MKLLSILILTIALSVGMACSSEPNQEPTPEATVTPKLTSGEVKAIVQRELRGNNTNAGKSGNLRNYTCAGFYARFQVIGRPKYMGDGMWSVKGAENNTGFGNDAWYVYENTQLVETVGGHC